jgi:hypothetical protein
VRAFGSRIGISARIARHVFLDMCGHRTAVAPEPTAPGPRLTLLEGNGERP